MGPRVNLEKHPCSGCFFFAGFGGPDKFIKNPSAAGKLASNAHVNLRVVLEWGSGGRLGETEVR